MRISDWSSDVCSSDLRLVVRPNIVEEQAKRALPQRHKHVEFGQLADAHSRNAGVDDRMAAIAAKPARWLVEHLSVALLELPGRARADDMLVAIKILNRVERCGAVEIAWRCACQELARRDPRADQAR